MQSEIREKRFDREVFKILMAIKKEVIPPHSLVGMPEGDLVALVVDSIREVSDKLGIPIFRIKNEVFIYQESRPLTIPKKPFEEFLAWVALHLGIEKELVYNIPFRNQLYGRMWRVMAPAEEEKKETSGTSARTLLGYF